MENWEKVYHITPCYFFSFSNDGSITRINNVLLDHLGYSESEVLQLMKLEELLTVGSRIFFQTHFYPLIKMQGHASEIFLSFKTKDGLELPVLLNVVLEQEENGFEIHCGGMQISNRNRFEKELLEAKKVAENALLENKELNDVKLELQQNQEILEQQLRKLSRINTEHQQINKVLAHDLQEPIRKISMFSKKLVDDIGETLSPYTVSYLRKITVASAKIRNLIISMERFISLDNKQLHYTGINCSEIVAEAKKRLKTDEHTDIVFTETNMLPLTADFELLVQVFTELISNSIKFRKRNKEALEIGIRCEYIMQNIFQELDNKYKYTRFVRITYTDNGEGFSNEYAERLFGLFQRGNITQEGLGLGLAQCKKIIEMHHGLISATATPNVGVVFTLLLPAVEKV